VIWLLLLVLAGPAQTVAGKYVQHSDEFKKAHPAALGGLPSPLPTSADELCAVIESGHATPDLFAALGDALLAEKRSALAYRAFHRAHRMRPKDAEWGRRMLARKRRSTRVPESVIQAEEREAAVWVEALQDYERETLEQGGDARDLAPFFERYGQPEANVFKYVRQRRFSGAGGIAGILMGIIFLLAARLMRRGAAVVPLLIGIACLLGPTLVGQQGLFGWGAGFALAGAAATFSFGRKRK